ncbi:MAG: hypothetical protein M1372_02585, partial [Patescibacteria group bacterium]|nr:hypothetical protein [Patescibacteria group bacterium]
MKGYATIYNFYKTTVIRLFRFIFFVFIIWLVFQNVSNNFFPSVPSRFSAPIQSGPIFLLSLFLIFEVFFRFKISRTYPSVLISENDGKDIYKSFSFKSLCIFWQSNKTSSVIKSLLREKSALFILDKADIKQNEVPLLDLPKEELSKYAFEIAKNARGKYVTTSDLLVSYLLLIEDAKKLLLSKNLKK